MQHIFAAFRRHDGDTKPHWYCLKAGGDDGVKKYIYLSIFCDASHLTLWGTKGPDLQDSEASKLVAKHS